MQRLLLVGSPNNSFEPASLGLRVLYSGLVCTKVHQTLPLGTIRVVLASNKVDRG